MDLHLVLFLLLFAISITLGENDYMLSIELIFGFTPGICFFSCCLLLELHSDRHSICLGVSPVNSDQYRAILFEKEKE